MKEIIAIINQKGGVGKSTTALTLGKTFAVKGLKILFIDLDAQGNLSYTMKAETANSMTSFELLTNRVKAAEVIQHT